MSVVNEKKMSKTKTCNYVLRQGRNKGSKCFREITKKDPYGARCCFHYTRPRNESDVEEESEDESDKITFIQKITDDEAQSGGEKDTNETNDQQEKWEKFEKRYQEEMRVMKEEQEYRKYKQARLAGKRMF